MTNVLIFMPSRPHPTATGRCSPGHLCTLCRREAGILQHWARSLFADDNASSRIPHPSLGACTKCGSERLTPMVRTGQTAPEALRCECCGLVLSIEEHSRLRAAAEGVPTLRVLR